MVHKYYQLIQISMLVEIIREKEKLNYAKMIAACM